MVRPRLTTVSTFESQELCHAVLQRNETKIKSLLKGDSGKELMRTREWSGGHTFGYEHAPLHRAAIDGLTDIMVIFLDHGASVDSLVEWENLDLESLLHSAVRGNQLEMVRLLVERGACTAIKGRMHSLTNKGQEIVMENPKELAEYEKYVDIMEVLENGQEPGKDAIAPKPCEKAKKQFLECGEAKLSYNVAEDLKSSGKGEESGNEKSGIQTPAEIIKIPDDDPRKEEVPKKEIVVPPSPVVKAEVVKKEPGETKIKQPEVSVAPAGEEEEEVPKKSEKGGGGAKGRGKKSDEKKGKKNGSLYGNWKRNHCKTS